MAATATLITHNGSDVHFIGNGFAEAEVSYDVLSDGNATTLQLSYGKLLNVRYGVNCRFDWVDDPSNRRITVTVPNAAGGFANAARTTIRLRGDGGR